MQTPFFNDVEHFFFRMEPSCFVWDDLSERKNSDIRKQPNWNFLNDLVISTIFLLITFLNLQPTQELNAFETDWENWLWSPDGLKTPTLKSIKWIDSTAVASLQSKSHFRIQAVHSSSAIIARNHDSNDSKCRFNFLCCRPIFSSDIPSGHRKCSCISTT